MVRNWDDAWSTSDGLSTGDGARYPSGSPHGCRPRLRAARGKISTLSSFCHTAPIGVHAMTSRLKHSSGGNCMTSTVAPVARRTRSRTGRSRTTGRRPQNQNPAPITEDDVLVQVSGILDVRDNHGFVRTEGYLPGPDDVYVAAGLIKRHGLRRGDEIVGVVREGETGNKANPLVRLDSVNGGDPEQARRRPEFYDLTPLFPQERLRLETDANNLTTRVIDLVMPLGKGQRALIVAPPKAGKTMILQNIANAISRNNPEVHLLLLLADERPLEVTAMQRSVKGEVIASTFDRPPSDHKAADELAVERAKPLHDRGHDVAS